MVYCGKPSRGCSNCRQRKIRCDQASPACGQCVKVHKDCPGYRNMIDLAFRNESEDVIRKAKAKSRKSPPRSTQASHALMKASHKAASGTNASSSSVIVPPSSTLASEAQSPARILYQYDLLGTDAATSSLAFCMQSTIEDNGFNYFIFNFVRLPNGPSRGYFAYIEDMCRHGMLDEAPLAAITAAGLAGLATKSKSSPLMTKARREYARALQKINAALRSPTESLKDDILLAILIVAIFETIAGAKQLSLKEWTEHINGAATLIKLRGRDQLKRRGSLNLFMTATTHVLLSCIQREIAMPSQLIELRTEAFDYLPMDPGYQYIRMADHFSIFRFSVKTGAFKDAQAIIRRGLELDYDLAQSFTNIPPGWAYESAFTNTECDLVFDGSYDIYYDHWVAQMWNAMRSSRIMLHETIRRQLIKDCTSESRLFTDEYFRTQFQASTNICKQMRTEIFRSVPQFLGYVTRKPFTSSLNSTTSSPPYVTGFFSDTQNLDFDPSISFMDLLLNDAFQLPLTQKETLHQDPTHPSIGGFFLLWPLYVAGITRVNTPEHRDFVIKTLQYIGETVGIRAGSNLAAFLKEHSASFGNGKANMDPSAGRFRPELLADGEPKEPLIEMLAREEKERAERVESFRGMTEEVVAEGLGTKWIW